MKRETMGQRLARRLLQDRHDRYVRELRARWEARRRVQTAGARRANGNRIRGLCALIADVRASAAHSGIDLRTGDARPLSEVLAPRAWTWGQARGCG